jgi:hypothetical protein
LKTYLGIPVVTSTNVFDVVRQLGIKPWIETRPPMPLSAWLQTASEAEHSIYERFGPKPEVQFLAQPEGANAGKEDIFFRMIYKPWVTVVAIISGEKGEGPFIPLAVEWKQGNRLATLTPVSGVAGKAEAGMSIRDAMRAAGKREFLEETGFELEHIELVGARNGFYDQVRATDLRFFAAAGRVKLPLGERKPTKLDGNEFIKLVLMDVFEWLNLLEDGVVHEGFCLESCATTATYLALRRFGLLEDIRG